MSYFNNMSDGSLPQSSASTTEKSAANSNAGSHDLMHPANVMFSKFSDLRDNRPKMRSTSLDEFMALFEQHATLAMKDQGKVWSPTIYGDGATRGSANVQAVTALVLDVDDGTPLENIATKFKPFRYVAHSSHSHTEAKPKYRVVLPLESPVPAGEWSGVWARLSLFVDGHIDSATKDPGRIYFLPSKPPSATGHFVAQNHGRLITVDDLPDLPKVVKETVVTVHRSEKKKQVNVDLEPVDDLSQYEDSELGLEKVVERCHFLSWASAEQNQKDVSEPQWMAMLSNACRFQGGREFAHQASKHDARYVPSEVDDRLRRHRAESGPISCEYIQSTGFNKCPKGGCIRPKGEVTKAPAGLVGWKSAALEKIDHPTLLHAFVAHQFPGGLTCAHGEYYCYRDGAYDKLDETSQVKQPLMDFLGSWATSGRVKSLGELLAVRQAKASAAFVPDQNYLCLTNSTLNLTTRELEPHSPEHQLRTRLNVPWSSDAQCPRFKAYLNSVFEHDSDKAEKIAFVQEWMGYTLVPDASMQKMLWLVGAGANGKSVFLAIIKALVGEENVSNAMIDTFDTPHIRAELEGKLLNISGEIASDAMINDAYIKAIVAGDMIEASRKYKPSFSFRPYVKLMAATNNLPKTNDTTHGFYRRTIILMFNRRFSEKEQNPNLINELLEELAGILKWAVDGLKRLREQKIFTIPASCMHALEQYREESNPVQLFADECLVKSTDCKMTTRDLMALYEAWCRAHRFQTRNSSTFGRCLSELGYEPFKSNGTRGWWVARSKNGDDLAWSQSLHVAVIRDTPDQAEDVDQQQISPLAKNYVV